MKTHLIIEGMSCVNCVKHATRALLAVEGVTDAQVSLDPGEATVEHTGVKSDVLIAVLEEEGYTANVG